MPVIDIRPAEFPGHLETVRFLFRAYAASLDISLAFQDFDAELANLPADYAPPRGRLLLAWQGSQGGSQGGSQAGSQAIGRLGGHAESEAVGCVALRPIDEAVCEMKRLYVSPAARAGGLGRRLAARICAEARAAGYRRMRLDTLPSMTAARRVYEGLGFRPIAPYCFNPVPDAVFLERDLEDPAARSPHFTDSG